MRHLAFALASSMGMLLGTVGCGGGDGGDTGASAALGKGHYHLAAVSGPAGIALGDVTASWGVASFDGVSTWTETYFWNLDGNVFPTPRPGPPDATYAIDPDRTIRFLPSVGEYARGGITSDGALALLSSHLDGYQPQLRVYGRREGTYPLWPLVGTWRLVGFSHAFGIPRRVAAFGSMTFDATGNGSMSASLNADGAILGPAVTLLEYGLFADGGLLVSFPGGELFEGGVVRGGDVIFLAGDTESGGDPTFMLLVREVPAPPVAGLAGSWFVSAFGYDLAATDYFGLGGRASADATGNLTFTVTRNQEGTISTLPPVGGAWAVDGSGLVTLTLPAGDTLVGRAAPGGDFVVLAGATTAPSNPVIFVFLR